ncbi:MAG: methyl-accepting chemotaxis protein [Lachnospiraceae bacterium]|nr:methyl-accepting chemotaxis protein [Lachnospiraceae bacterium]
MKASANLLGDTLNNFINSEYNSKFSGQLIERLSTGVSECEKLVKDIQQNTSDLNRIQQRQNILALNASIEAARAGDAGKGFAVVAKEVGNLSVESRQLNEQITKTIDSISQVVHNMTADGEL